MNYLVILIIIYIKMWYVAFETKYEMDRELRQKAQKPCEDKFSIIRMVTFGGGNITECSQYLGVWNYISGRL